MDWKLELVVVPVSDVDQAKAFYSEKAGFHLDHDHMRPGSLKGLQLVVSDVAAAREQLVKHGVEVSELQTFDWGKFVFFHDPDGNRWSVQQLPLR